MKMYGPVQNELVSIETSTLPIYAQVIFISTSSRSISVLIVVILSEFKQLNWV